MKQASPGTYYTERNLYSTDSEKALTYGRVLKEEGEILAVILVDISPELLDEARSILKMRHGG